MQTDKTAEILAARAAGKLSWATAGELLDIEQNKTHWRLWLKRGGFLGACRSAVEAICRSLWCRQQQESRHEVE